MKRRGSIEGWIAVTIWFFVVLLVQLTPVTSVTIPGSSTLARLNIARLAFPSIIPKNDTRCYGELGCLTVDARFRKSFNQVTNLLPSIRQSIGTKFILYNRVHWKKGLGIKVANPMSIKRTRCDFHEPTKFIIHGYKSAPTRSWIAEIITELLAHKNYNVVVVSWEKGASDLYPQSAANTRLVGLEIAHLINHLRTNYRLKLEDVHLIGHSLGAHAAGFAGAKLEGRIGRITGLDPAKPYFESAPIDLRLDPSDAMFVDVIHTSTKGPKFPVLQNPLKRIALGMNRTCGHLDFYPNGGSAQPNCKISRKGNIIGKVKDVFSKVMVCSHQRSIHLFIESINSRCSYLSVPCRDYHSFRRGECFDCSRNKCAIMGYHADTSPTLEKTKAEGRNVFDVVGKKFYLISSGESPYCRPVLRVTVNLRSPLKMRDGIRGYLNVTVRDEKMYHNFTVNLEKIGIPNGLVIKFIPEPTAREIVNVESLRATGVFWGGIPIFKNNQTSQVKNIHIDVLNLLHETKFVKEASDRVLFSEWTEK